MSYKKMSITERKERARDIRFQVAEIAYDRPHKPHNANGDETLPKRLMSFTKGLPHNWDTGLIKNEADFEKFIDGICTGDPDVIDDTPLGLQKQGKAKWRSSIGKKINTLRGWESAGAGLTFDLQGPDAQAVTMPPSPKLGTDEFTAEMAEVYVQAVLRDTPFSEFEHHPLVNKCLTALNKLTHFKKKKRNGQLLSPQNAFRGVTKGDLQGSYVSQFLLAGNGGLNHNGSTPEFKANEGKINYGSIIIDQKVRRAQPTNYLTNWAEFYDAQNGADFGGQEEYIGLERRFITSGRDLATYVHYDALYEAYLNACLILLNAGAVYDKGVPFQKPDHKDKQKGFAHYGGPHILTLVTEVATRALKAVRFQKFNVHRRLRPEAFAARLHKKDEILNEHNVPGLANTYDDLEKAGIFDLLPLIGNRLLPMAFYEGSPMHPTYGAGHATVAGACVTILKAFFNHKQYINIAPDGSSISFSTRKKKDNFQFVPEANGYSLLTLPINTPLTVEGELNKLAANISIGRDWAGVHYYSDYTKSLLLGEEIALGLLEEQSVMYNPLENFNMTVPRFDGTIATIPHRSGNYYDYLS